jgi:hypothetical protein
MLRHSNKLCGLMLCASAAAILAAAPAIAQSAPATATVSGAAATETAVGKLLQKMVTKKVLSRGEAQEMMDGLHADLAKGVTAPQTATPAPEAGAVRVPYVSKTVRQEIADQVKAEVMTQAKDERWAAPNEMPEWTKRIHVFGDIRVRDENRFFNKNNSNDFIDTYAANTGSAIDIHAAIPALPVLNSTQNRNFVRLRARLGVGVDISDSWTAAVRLATGSDNSPVTTNQTLANDFGKKSIWLDQAYIKFEPLKGDSLVVGRMPQPFVRTDLVWSENVNPDGIAANFGHDFGALNLHGVGAAFTLDGASDNAPANAVSNNKVGGAANRWMFGGQLGAQYDLKPLKLSFDAAYYNYANVSSKLSAACSNVSAPVTGCDTDSTRPTFMQKGNTLFLMRQIVDVANNGTDPQYFGLASKFEVLDLIASADYAVSDKLHVTLTGDFARNLAYSKTAITALPIVNNNETCSVTVPSGKTCAQASGVSIFKSGNNAWLGKLTVGNPHLNAFGDWNASFAYAYIGPDAVLDAFTDSDFHLGGTNAKGWSVAANLGLTNGTWLTTKWISTNAVSGPRFNIDLLQVDLTTKF